MDKLKKGEDVVVAKLPGCDFCADAGGDEVLAAVDGATTRGPWANMCERHYNQYGVGLGVGKGQRLVVCTHPDYVDGACSICGRAQT